MHERIKKLRKALGLTQQEFADRLNIGRGTLANYEVGRNEPIDAVVTLICREFNVSEEWLRTGEGEMFVQRTKGDELTAAVERLMSGESAEFKSRLVRVLASLDEKYWVILEEKLREIVGMQDVIPAIPSTTKLYVAARDGSRVEAEIDDDFTIPENDTELPE